jgi:hypothetical protein
MVEIRIGVHTAVAHVLDETRNYELVRRLERTETMTICESGDRKIQIPKRCSAMRMQIGVRGTRRSPSALRDFLFYVISPRTLSEREGINKSTERPLLRFHTAFSKSIRYSPFLLLQISIASLAYTTFVEARQTYSETHLPTTLSLALSVLG